jgi:hypothetical protein
VPLAVERDGRTRVIGGVALLPGESGVKPVSPALLDELARALFEAGDVV